jgi:DnaJ-class molecular chaperone
VLGGEIEIETIDNKKMELKIPKQTASGTIFRKNGGGIPHFSKNGKGDLFVEVITETPNKLTKDQEKLLKDLKKSGL